MENTPLTVLLIEDEPADVKFIQMLLSDSVNVRFQFEHADRLSASIDKLLSGLAIDVVLLDLSLPDGTGFDTLSAVQKAAATVPVVVLTGTDDEELGVEAMRRGAQDYLVKGSVEGGLLTHSLRYAIERNQARLEASQREARLRLLTEQVPAILWTTDEALRFTSSLGKSLGSLGLQPNQMVGATLFEFFQTEDEDFLPVAMHRRAMQGEAVSAEVNWGGRWFHAHVQPLQNSEGHTIGTVGVALDVTDQRKMEESIAAARRIQRHLLPPAAPQRPGFDVAGACYPAAHCSGDYFDYIPMRDDCLAIVLADVAGHGIGPAILAASVRSYLRATALQGLEVHEMLTAVNWLLNSDTDGSQFVTLICCQLDPRSKSLVYAAAGQQAYLIRASGRIKTLESTSLPLGLEVEEITLLSRRTALFDGDILLFVTDGALEALSPDEEEFGIRRALDVVQRNRDRPASEIVEVLYCEICEFCDPAPLHDDVTIVIVKVISPSGDSPHAGESQPAKTA